MDIIGHNKIIKLLDKSIAKNTVSQSYLFSGPEAVGKFTVAKYFAEKLIGSADGIIADLKIIKPEVEEKKGVAKKLDIKIEEMRDLLRWLSLSSQGGGHKAVIIDDADFLTKAAQNAILKNLEEPNPGVVLILVAQDENKIIPTIRSRCRKIKFGIVPDKELEDNLAEQKNGKEIIFWSFGRPGILHRLSSSSEEMEFMRESEKELVSLFTRNIAEKFSLAEKLAKDESLLVRKMNLWLMVLRKKMLGGSEAGPLRHRIEASGISRQKILVLIEKMAEGLRLVRETNSNTRLVLENLFLDF